MAQITLTCFIVCIYYLPFILASPIITEEAMKTRKPDLSKEANDAIELLKTNFEQLVRTVKENDIYKGLNEKIKIYGDEIVVQGQQLIEENIK